MSRNARPTSEGTTPIPLWREVCERLAAQLGDHSYLHDVLRLSETYERTFGRTALDREILDLIPDEEYEPGPVHEQLLRLPWSDIFTTNYDTLLERARDLVPLAKWDVVGRVEELATAGSNRIVKLHGSFPSQRPFIFTAEDFRTYPQKFAPFVNTVQQAIMEGTVCLVGFSGDDPNFLQWAGWVRDHLGSAAPKIYLCGVLGLDDAKVRHYDSLRVIPVDLGRYCSSQDPLDAFRHESALAAFLTELESGAPPDYSAWPFERTERMTRGDRAGGLQDVSTPPAESDLRSAKEWLRETRAEYPGWVVCPESNRYRLFSRLSDSWLFRCNSLGDIVARLPGTEAVHLVHEVLWAFSTMLLPIEPPWVRAAEDTLERYCPFPAAMPGKPHHTLSPSWEDKLAWAHAAFFLLEDAAALVDAERFARWSKRLEPIAGFKPEWRARWGFETAWFRLCRLDYEGAAAALEAWPDDPTQVFFQGKKAALLAELGRTDDALSVAEEALHRARRTAGASNNSPSALSREGWLARLVQVIRLSRAQEKDPSRVAELAGPRFDELYKHRADPLSDIERRAEAVLKPAKPRLAHHLGFDPGAASRSFNLGGPRTAEWVLYLTMHRGCIPMALVGIAERAGLLETARRLWETGCNLGLAVAARGCSPKNAEDLLDRTRLAGTAPGEARALYSPLAVALRSALAVRPGFRTAHERQFEILVRVLSRLTAVLDASQRDDAWSLALDVYRTTYEAPGQRLVESAAPLFGRLAYATPPAQLKVWLPQLLQLPLPGAEGRPADRFRPYVDPVALVLREMPESRSIDASVVPDPQVQSLIDHVRSENDARRELASRRLLGLLTRGLLEPAQEQAYAEAVWSRCSEDGQPVAHGATLQGLSMLKWSRASETREALAHWVTATPIPSLQVKHQGVAGVSPDAADQWLRDVVGLTSVLNSTHPFPLDADQVGAILEQLETWWVEASPLWKPVPRTEPFGTAWTSLATSLVNLVGFCILPRLSEPNDAKRAEHLLSELSRKGHDVTSAQPALLLHGNQCVEDMARRIRRLFRGAREDEIRVASVAVQLWLGLEPHSFPPVPDEVLDALLLLIELRRRPGLDIALRTCTSILKGLPERLGSAREARLGQALGALAACTRPDADDDLPFDDRERLHHRWLGALLSAQLAQGAARRGEAAPEGLSEWQREAQESVLPEVRRAWSMDEADLKSTSRTSMGPSP